MTHDFETPEEALAHYGVKGMHWGVHRDGTTDSQIHDARARVGAENKQFRKDKKLVKQETKALSKARREKVGELKLNTLANPDRLTAARMTHGEKMLLTLLAPVAPYGVAGAVGGNIALKKTVREAIAEKAIKDQRA